MYPAIHHQKSTSSLIHCVLSWVIGCVRPYVVIDHAGVLEGVACHISISLWASGKVNAAKSRVLVFDKLGGSEFQVNRKWFHHHISHQCLCSHRSVEYFQSHQQKLITAGPAGIVHRFCVVWQDGVLQTHPHHPPVLAEAGQSFWTSRS